jgi:signal transduction histidine kinase
VVQVMTLGFLLAIAISGMAALVIRRDFGMRAAAAEALEQAMAEADEARTRAEEASRAKSDFLARMSHELRTPLNSIIGFSNVLLKNRGGTLQPQELLFLERITANGKQLLALINDILDLSKIEAGRVQIEHAPVALDELITDLVAGFEGQLQERDGVVIATELPAPMAPLVTDGAKLQQVLLNLIGNALKFTERGQVAVCVAVDPPSRCPVRIDVADTGVGIPPERHEAIFEAFEQADNGVARRYGGTGLGLAIARSLCMAMGYGLEVRENPGGGSVFSVLLAADGVPTEGGARRGARTPVRLSEVEGRDIDMA